MKQRWRQIHCGQSVGTRARSRSAIDLDLHGTSPSVILKISDLSGWMVRAIPDVLVDLIEIATYVFAADQSLGRGSVFDTGAHWRRHMDFRIPVRCPEVWSRRAVLDALVETLSFLTDDDYRFQFTKQLRPVPLQQYFELGGSRSELPVDQVQLFSGGVDSLAGAVQAAIHEKKNVVLVSHRSATKFVPKVDDLFERLRLQAASRLHRVAVWATTTGGTSREQTQRSRSFLYASLAASVASMLGLDSFSFYENGVTSMNLPISGQVVGARATRTTHPQTLRGFEKLLAAVLGTPFTVRSPFLWKTKAEVMQLVVNHDKELLPLSISCSRTIAATHDQPHCGTCSQCVDRRLAALALHLDDDADPSGQYKVDVLTGALAQGTERTMAESFVRRARTIRSSSDEAFFQLFPEATRVLKHTGLSANDAATRLLAVHRKHAEEVHQALVGAIGDNAADLDSGNLPDTCLLTLTLNEKYTQRRPESRETDSSDEAALIREGATWRVSFSSKTVTIKDSQGARYLAHLLMNPGRELSCSNLSMLVSGDVLDLPTDAGAEMADRRAIAEYRRHLDELDRAIAEAEAASNTEQTLILKDDRKKLAKQLSSVTRLGGRPRKMNDDSERARKAVCNALARLLSEIDLKHRALRSHLGTHLFTGLDCVYRPNPPVAWRVQASLP